MKRKIFKANSSSVERTSNTSIAGQTQLAARQKLKNFCCLFFFSFFLASNTQAIDFSGRASLLANSYQASEGDVGNSGSGDNSLNANQQSFRFMFEKFESHSEDNADINVEWLFHIKAYRQEFSGFAPASAHGSHLFRVKPLSNARDSQLEADGGSRFAYEVDLASVLLRRDNSSIRVGRQSIDWGTGRFWQPMNVFGAFAATDLDNDYKVGIDSAVMNYYPSSFSALTAIVAFSDDSITNSSSSVATRYRQQVGAQSEISLLLADVLENKMIGASLEGDVSGIGWRIEALHHNPDNGDAVINWIVGMDYQFDASTILTLEVFHHGLGVNKESELAFMLAEQSINYGLQMHLSERLLGMALQHELNPLLNVTYALLGSSLEESAGETKHSFLHQLSFLYSVGNDSDLMFALMTANGKGLNAFGIPQSEFGHLPANVSLRFRHYF